MRTIRRYANRKLYDTTEHHYITLKNVAAFVRAGDQLEVIDHVTGAKLTAQTLAQVIFEEEKASPRLSIEVLSNLIKSRASTT